MSGVNRVFVIGNLGAKPELKYLPSGQAVAELRVAVNEKWKNKEGQLQERVEWVSVVVWGKAGESCAQYLDKGRQVCVEGRLQTRDWLDKETNQKRYKTEVVSTQVTFLGTKGESRNDFVNDAPQDMPREDSGRTVSSGDDDIPF